jgi:hypothetical protein
MGTDDEREVTTSPSMNVDSSLPDTDMTVNVNMEGG